jgi:hypothetical protein
MGLRMDTGRFPLPNLTAETALEYLGHADKILASTIQPMFSGPHASNDPPAVRTFSVHDPVGQNKNPGPFHNRFAARRTIGVVSRMRWNIAHIGIVKAF